jgi:nucleoid-associated protein YgaU
MKSKDGLSLESVSGMKGEELKAFQRLQSDKLKLAEAQLVTRITGDQNWTGLGYTLSAKGDRLKVEFKKVEPIGVSVAKEMTEAEMLEKLGMTAEEYAPIRAAKEAKAKAEAEAEAKAKAEAQAIIDQEAKELAELAKEIEEENAANAAKNGEVEEVTQG